MVKRYFSRSTLGSRDPVVPATPIRNRRGDIHSNLNLTPSTARRPQRPTTNDGDNATSDVNGPLFIPSSAAAPQLSAPVPSSEPDEIRAIWGTNVNLAQTMKMFKEFLRGFKPKYRIAHDRSLNLPTRVLPNPESGEELLYETYLRRMRQTGQTNLNVDMINILSFPPSRKLHSQLIKYPQEVIPAMDQVLKDVMLELAELDVEEGLPGMQGLSGDEEIADIMGKVYKVRPFGEQAGNMRDLNPTGEHLAFSRTELSIDILS